MSNRAPLVGALLALVVGCTVNTEGQGANVSASGGSSQSGGTGGSVEGGSGAAGVGGTAATGGSGGSAGGGAGAAAGSAGASGGGGSAGAGGPEVCDDGKDNDGNGAIDCADGACTTDYVCVATAPAGWDGYFRLAQQAYDPNAPAGAACPDGSTPQRSFDTPAPAECSACSCGSVSGQCSAPAVQCSLSSDDCSGAAGLSSSWQDYACHKPNQPAHLSCSVQAGTLSGGSCPPSVSSFTNPMFKGITDVCGSPTPGGGGCSAGQACVHRGTGAYAGFVCIRQAGEQAQCPAGWSTRVVTYQNGTDGRSCGACACAPPAACVGGKFTVWDGDGCTTPWPGGSDPVDINAGAGCVNATSQLDLSSWSAQLWPSAPGGNCTPSGGQPGGSVATTGAMTYCCR